jgi:hypothetical protein
MRINRRWATCVALAAIPTIPFWFTVIWSSGRLAEKIFESSIAEWIVTVYIMPGIFALALPMGALSRALDWTDDQGVRILFVLGTLLSIIFWGTVLWGLYIGYRKIRNSK